MATEPSPLQREIIVAALTDPNATKDSLARSVGLSYSSIRYQLEALTNKRWLPRNVIDGINARSLTRVHEKRGRHLASVRAQRGPNVWAERISTLLQTDSHAVDRLARLMAGGIL